MKNLLKLWLATGNGKKILLLRHGEVRTASDEKRFIGQIDPPLSAKGRRQAQYWREWLDGVALGHIFSSDLCRCMETARIIGAERSWNITPIAGLREIHLGDWDGMAFGQVKHRWPEEFRRRGEEIARFRPPEGESFLDLQQRVVPVFEKSVDQAGPNILVVAHAGVNRMILCHLLGMPPDNLFRIAQGYGAMNLIDRRVDGYRVHSLNLPPA